MIRTAWLSHSVAILACLTGVHGAEVTAWRKVEGSKLGVVQGRDPTHAIRLRQGKPPDIASEPGIAPCLLLR